MEEPTNNLLYAYRFLVKSLSSRKSIKLKVNWNLVYKKKNAPTMLSGRLGSWIQFVGAPLNWGASLVPQKGQKFAPCGVDLPHAVQKCACPSCGVVAVVVGVGVP